MLATRPVVGEPSSSGRSSGARPREPGSPRVDLALVERVLLLLIILAAFAARVRELGAKSLWLDEGISVMFSLDGPPKLFQTLVSADIHPPLYYVVLHFWMQVAGRSETAVRFPSVLVGVLVVPLVAYFARQLFAGWSARATGVLAAALLAASPFMLYYAQEARMYGALAVAGLAATSALWSALHRGTVRGWILYGVLLAVPAYLHYFGWMVLAVHAAYVLLSLPRLGRRALQWAASLLLPVALYLPWLPSAVRQIVRLRETPDFWQGALSLWFVVGHAFAAFAVGFGGALERYPVVLALFAGVFGLGLLLVVGRGVVAGRPADLLLALYLLVPLALLYAVVARNPKFADRYLIVIVPPFALLIARGLVGLGELGVRLRHRRRTLGVATLVVAAGLALAVVGVSAREAGRVYADEAYAKDDFRGTVDYIMSRWREGDAVLLMIDTWQAFDYYSHGRLRRYGFGPTDDLEFVARELNGIVERGHQRLWIVFWNPEWADPTESIRTMLDETASRLPLDNPGLRGLPLRLYSLAERPRFDARIEPAHRLDAVAGERLRLLGVDGALDAPLTSGQNRRVTVYWEPLRQLREDLRVSYRLIGRGQEWWRHDTRPAAYTYPTMYWKSGRAVRGGFELEVPPGTPPGRYTVQAVVYDAATLAELPVVPVKSSDGPGTTLAEVVVVSPDRPASLEALPLPTVPARSLGGVELVALSPLPRAVDAGGAFELAAGWRGEDSSVDRIVDLWLRDASGRLHLLSSAPPGGPSHPTSRWQPGEVVVDRRGLVAPAAAAGGPATLLAGARRPDDTPRIDAAEPLGEIELRARAHVMQPPQPPRVLDLRIGQHARLVGVDAPARVDRGGNARVVLYWQALSDTRTGYKVFVHLVDERDRPVAQRDAPPGDGALPTTGWVPGEYLVDEHAVPVPADLAPGSYRLVAGMYDPANGRRAAVAGPGDREPDDRALLGTVVVR